MSANKLQIEVQLAVYADGLPAGELVQQWVKHALQGQRETAELVVRVVDEAEMTALNREYRGKDGPTNVLSFPYEPMPGVAADLLGDVVICAPVVAMEAIKQGKPLDSHWAHIVIHGVLHLLGHDHTEAPQAQEMEALETVLLTRLGFADPYQAQG